MSNVSPSATLDEFNSRNKIINLNVGGVKFATRKSTLLGEAGTYFDALIKSEQWTPDEDGVYFIDRNPRFFPAILDYLRMIANGRDGMLLVGSITPEEQRLLDDDIEYYMIGSLKRTLVASEHSGWKLDTRNMGNSLTMSEDCQTVTKTGVSGNCSSGVMGTHGFYDGTYRWRVILDAKESFWIFFGVSPVCYQDHPIHRAGAVTLDASDKGIRCDAQGNSSLPAFEDPLQMIDSATDWAMSRSSSQSLARGTTERLWVMGRCAGVVYGGLLVAGRGLRRP